MLHDLDAIAHAFAQAHRDPTRKVRAADLAAITRADAMAIQGKVVALLGDVVDVAKVAMPQERGATAAPIPARMVIKAGDTRDIGGHDFVGLEIEVAAVLRADIGSEWTRDAVAEAIDHYVLGIEIVGSRIDDRLQAGPFGVLADWMLTGGYVLGKDRFDREPLVEGLPVKMLLDGEIIQREVAKYPFRSAIEPIAAYAAIADDSFGGLRKGMTVTTGMLSPLLLLPRGGEVEIQVGGLPPVSFTLKRKQS